MLAALVVLVGCTLPEPSNGGSGDVDTDTDSDTDMDTDADTDADADADTSTLDTGAEHKLSIVWTESAVTVISAASGPMKFGMMTGPKDPPWEAEDCIGGTTAGLGPFCHTVQAGTDTVIPCVENAVDVTNDTTLFCHSVDADDSYDGITYYFAAMDDSWCLVSGPNEEHYLPVGCEQQ